jgi:hypothetical protein
MKTRLRARAPARPNIDSAAAASTGYRTGEPEKYAVNPGGIGVPDRKWSSWRLPT